MRPRPKWVYAADGLATINHSPFLEDREWTRLYEEMAQTWTSGHRPDVRWRMWLLTSLARQCQHLEGNFAEFGVYRGGCAFMLLATTNSRPRTLYLFDTFEGMPSDHLTEEEQAWDLGGRYSDTSVQHVTRFLDRWSGRFETCPGDVFETLERVETGALALAHVDLNSGEATQVVLDYVYPRLVSGGTIVFDDYGASGGGPQREVIHRFFEDRTEEVIAVPTGQAFVSRH